MRWSRPAAASRPGRAARFAAGLAAAAGLLGPPSAAQRGKDAPPARIELYSGRLPDARTAARERNVPLCVFVIQEGEEANDRFYEGIWKSPALPPALERALVVLVNDGEHPRKLIVEVRGDGTEVEREVCARFETVSCEEHRRNWDAVFQQFHKDGELRTPQTICVLPDGREQGRLVDVPESADRVAALVKAAQASSGPGLTAAEHRVAGPAAERGRLAAARADHAEALRSFEEALAHAPGGALRAEAEAGVALALAGLREWLADAGRRMEAGEVEAGYGRLVELVAVLAGTALERDARRALLAAEKRPEWKARIRAFKDERAAEAIAAEVEAHLAAGDAQQARAALRRLLKQHGETRAAEAARRRWPELLGGG